MNKTIESINKTSKKIKAHTLYTDPKTGKPWFNQGEMVDKLNFFTLQRFADTGKIIEEKILAYDTLLTWKRVSDKEIEYSFASKKEWDKALHIGKTVGEQLPDLIAANARESQVSLRAYEDLCTEHKISLAKTFATTDEEYEKMIELRK